MARQRFVAAGRAAARRRARRNRLAALVALPLALVSYVSMASVASTPVVRAVNAPAAYVDIPPARVVTEEAQPLTLVPTTPLEATGPSFLAGVGQRDRMRATLCLASAIYYEAATEPDEGQRAVAQVVLNRVRHAQWPHTVCGVVYQGSDRPGCQFSFACDGAMARGPSLAYWIRARRVAEAALNGSTYAPVGSATHYHTTQVSPAWGARLTPVGIVGAHIFYRLPTDRPEAASLPFAYRGGEPHPGPLPRVAPPAQLMTVAAPPPISVPVPMPGPVAEAAAWKSAPQPVQSRTPPSRDNRYVAGALPDSNIRPEYRDSGSWIAPVR